MPSLSEQLETLLTAAALAEEGLPEAALEVMGERPPLFRDTAPEPLSYPPQATPQHP